MSKKGKNNLYNPLLVGRDSVNWYNRQLVLSLFKGGKILARRDIVAITGMRQGTMQVHVENLLKEGILVEKGTAKTNVGRRPRMLQINPRRYYLIGAHLQIDRVDMVVADLLGNPIKYHTERPSIIADRVHLLLALDRGFNSLISGLCSKEDIYGIAIGIPGRVDTSTQKIIDTLFDPWWKGGAFVRYVRSQIGCQCWIDNDIRFATLGEGRFGSARGVSNFIYIRIGEQIQSGIMVDGRLYSGQEGLAGRLGHICVEPTGVVCRCGNRGCLNTVASEAALIEFYKSLIGKSRVRRKKVTIEKIIERARKDEEPAKYAITEVAKWIGLTCANLTNIFNPAKIILAGQITLAGELFISTVKQVINERTTEPESNVQVEWSSLGEKGVAMGGIARAIDEFFALPAIRSPIVEAENNIRY